MAAPPEKEKGKEKEKETKNEDLDDGPTGPLCLPYKRPFLEGTYKPFCTMCRKKLGKDGNVVAWACPDCAYLTCSACDPTGTGPSAEETINDHDRFCRVMRPSAGPALVRHIFDAPREIAGKVEKGEKEGKGKEKEKEKEETIRDEESIGTAPLFSIAVVDYIHRRSVDMTPESTQELFELSRSGEGFELLAIGDLYEKKRLTEREVLERAETEPSEEEFQKKMDATVMSLALKVRYVASTSLGQSLCDWLFGCTILMARPEWDTLAQVANFNANLMDVICRRHIAFSSQMSDLPTEVREAMTTFQAPLMEIRSFVDEKTKAHVSTMTVLGESNKKDKYTFEERLDLEIAAFLETKTPMNVCYYIHLLHTKQLENDQIVMSGPFYGVDKMPPEQSATLPWRRAATTDLVLRISGDPHDPVISLYRSSPGLYSLEDWMNGTLFRPEHQRLAREDLAAKSSDFDIMQMKGIEPSVWNASLRLHRLVKEPEFAGAERKALRGLENLRHFARAIDTLTKNAKPALIAQAYRDITGILWPSNTAHALYKFVVTYARANLAA
jgi:hypothetical protein